MEQEQVVSASCKWTVSALTEALTLRGYRVERSFDLRSALHSHGECTCPYHGTEQCTCEYMVLFVYEETNVTPPVVIIAHGRNGITWLQIQTSQLENALSSEFAVALDETMSAALSAT
jgi:hypothetical protein